MLSTLGAESPGFIASIPMPVKSFVVEVQGQGDFPCNGNSLSPQAKAALSNLKAGQRVYINNIKVLSPKKTIVPIAEVCIKIKA